MRLAAPLEPDRRALLARANPVAKLGAALALLVVLFVSVDLLTPSLLLVLLIACLPLSGLPLLGLLARSWPLLITAAVVGVLNGLVVGGWSTGAALAIRLVAIAGSGVLALATTDPTELADALQQQLHLPPRPALGALAALRLLPVMSSEWRILALARRARGVSADGSPLAWLRLAWGQLLSLLIGAVRRATQLALAMDARGFGSRARRSLARPRPMVPLDWGVLAAGLAAGLAAVGVSLAAGSWRSLFG